MKRIVSISLGSSQRDYQLVTTVLGQHIDVRRIGTNGDVARATELVREHDGVVDAIGLGGLTPVFRVGPARYPHRQALSIAAGARRTPVVDGGMLKATLERWAVQKAADMVRGIFNYRRVLITSGIERYPMAAALARFAGELRCADPIVHLGLSFLPPPRSLRQLEIYAATTLPFLALLPYKYVHPVALGQEGHSSRAEALFQWADVIAGDFAYIRRFAPADLRGKVIVTDDPSPDELDDMAARGVATLVTMTPPLSDERPFVGTDVLEAIVVAVQESGTQPREAEALDFIDATGWGPTVEHLNPRRARPKFAFVTHTPARHTQASQPRAGLTGYLSRRLAENRTAPRYLAHIRGIRSQASGAEVEGLLISLGASSPDLARRPAAAYQRQLRAARIAERMGARLMGLGLPAALVGDAGMTVAQRSAIGVTSGGALALAAALEAATQAAQQIKDNSAAPLRAMVIGATTALGAVCARLLAEAHGDVVLIASQPERLLALKQTIERESPGTRVIAATRADIYLGGADLVVLAAEPEAGSLEIEHLKPGAVICDLARPAALTQADAARRPDLLAIDGGAVDLPGAPDYSAELDTYAGVDAGLAEAALLALDGRFGDYSIGRNVEIERVREMRRLMQKHGMALAGPRSFGRRVAAGELAEKRRLAAERRQRLGLPAGGITTNPRSH
jgi:predicted amino acid dehydrogenase